MIPEKDTLNLLSKKINIDYIKSLLEQMIEINSVVGNEKDLATFLAEKLQELGLAIQLEEVEKDRPNIYAHYSFNNKGKTLTFCGHLDTVSECTNWTHNPFIPYEKNGNIIGLGAADQKGGIACQIAVIKALIDSGLNLSGTIHFTGVVDEEGYGKGAKKLLTNPFFGQGKTNGIIISEPYHGNSQQNPLPLGMSGKVLYKIIIKGRSAHAFHPEEGINAISDAAKILVVIDELMKGNLNSFKNYNLPFDSDFGYDSFCVLKVEGGYKIYSVVVPETCEIILNRLTSLGQDKEFILNDLYKLINNLSLDSKVNIEIIPPFYYPYKILQSDPLFNSISKSYKNLYGKKPFTSFLKMITDANIFMGEGNIPTILFGPKGGNLHSANEFVDVESLKNTALIYCQTFLNFQKEL